jgi:hypothetical protein
MARTKGVSQRQIHTIRSLSRRGYTANQQYRILQANHIGMRRQKLLGYVREFKNRPARPNVEKYTRIRYRHRPIQFDFGKRVILRGKWKGKNKEIEQRDSGSKLKDFVIREMLKAKHGEGWDFRPQVSSQ